MSNSVFKENLTKQTFSYKLSITYNSETNYCKKLYQKGN